MANDRDGAPFQWTTGAVSEEDLRRIEHLVAALKAGDFDSFTRHDLPPPKSNAYVPSELDSLRTSHVENLRRATFGQFAGRVAGLRHIRHRVMESGDRYLMALVSGSEPADFDVTISVIATGTGTGSRYYLANVRAARTEHLLDAFDQAHIDRVVAALMAGDWEEYRRLVPGSFHPAGADRDYFNLFAYKVGGLKGVRNKELPPASNDSRRLELLLANRQADGPDLTLTLRAAFRGTAANYGGGPLLEEGFDRTLVEAPHHERIRQEIEARRIALLARVRASLKAVRIPATATDDEILAILRRWNDTMAARDYQAALDMIVSREGWTSGDQLRAYVETFDTGDYRQPPHRVTPFATAGELRSPREVFFGRSPNSWPEHSVFRDHHDKVWALFTPPLDGYWAPFFVEFELVTDDQGMWVLCADHNPFADRPGDPEPPG